MPRYQVTLDGKTFIVEGDRPPSESEARSALQAYEPPKEAERKPASAEDFMRPEDIANRDNGTSIAGDIARGFGKRAVSSVVGLGEMAVNAGMMPGVTPSAFNPAMRHPVFTRADEATAPTNDAQRAGGRMEMAAELAPGAIGLAKAVPGLARSAAPHLARAASAVKGNAGSLALDAAEFIPGIGRGVKLARMMGRMKSAAPVAREAAEAAPAVSANIGGRIVKPSSGVSAEDEIANALGELRTELDAPVAASRVQLPPPAELTPGTKAGLRTTAPKPRAAKMAGPTSAQPPKAGPAAQPKRAYFLKSPEDMAPVLDEPVEALGRAVTMDDLPMAWRSRAGQSLLPEQGASGADLSSNALAEVAGRGLSPEQALEAVAKNPRLTPKVRLQLREALLASLGQPE